MGTRLMSDREQQRGRIMSTKTRATRRFIAEQRFKLRRLRRTSARGGPNWVGVQRDLAKTEAAIQDAAFRETVASFALI
jgi:hypothetical protein